MPRITAFAQTTNREWSSIPVTILTSASSARKTLVLVLIILGNPSSGGPVPRPLLNGFYAGLNPVMPQGAALSVARGVQYFGARGIDLRLLCLLIWVLAGLALLGAAVFRDALRTWPRP